MKNNLLIIFIFCVFGLWFINDDNNSSTPSIISEEVLSDTLFIYRDISIHSE